MELKRHPFLEWEFRQVSGYIEVHPVFLYESVLMLLVFIFLRIMQKKRKFKGQILYLYFILYGFIRFFLEGLRTDSLMLGNFRVSQILSLVLFVVFLIIYLKNRIFCRNMKHES